MEVVHTTYSDEEILSCIKQNMDKGFNLLLKKYQEKLYWNIRRIVITHDDANDVLQETMIKIWKNISSFKQESQLFTWLYRISTNEALTYIKKHKKTEIQSPDEIYQLLKSEQSMGYYSGDEIEIKLQQAIASLPDKQKLVFNLKYFEELKYEDISSILDTSVGALKASYHIAVKKIEEFLKSN